MRALVICTLTLVAGAPAALADTPPAKPGIGPALRAAGAKLPATARDRPMTATRARTLVSSVLRRDRLVPDAVTCRRLSRIAAACTVRATSTTAGTSHWAGSAQVRVGAQVLVSYSLESPPPSR